MAEEYFEAKRMGDREKRMAIFTGENPYLPALEDTISASDIAAEIDLGLHEIPLSLIVGTRTKGRQNAFSANFMPLLADGSEFSAKWQSLFNSQIKEGLRDPIKCYEYLNRFYVEEGNKRVSVMKYLGAYSIHANVIRILPKRTDEQRIRVYYEFLEFYNVTGLFDIVFSQEGRYQQLAVCLGQNLSDPWPEALLADFRTAFNNFSKVYSDKGGDRLLATTYDAFLVYLKVYSLGSLLQDSPSEIHRRIGRLWREIEAEGSSATVAIADSPEAIEKASGITQAAGAGFRRLFGAAHAQGSAMRVAFLYEKTAQTSSWVYGHELGRLDVSHRLGERIDTVFFDNCDTTERTEKAIEAAIADECEVIFTTSPSMMPAARKAAVENPKVRFLNCSINLSVSTVRTYYSRMYEAKFLMGILAASLTENHRVGYVADYPLYGTVANINAFAAGAAMADPLCRVELIWTGLADETKKSFSPEVRIISGSDFIRPEDDSRKYGLFRLEDDGKVTILASPVPEWGRYYELILASVLDESYDKVTATKKGSPLNYWYGMAEGVISIILSGDLSYNTKKLVNAFRSSILTGSFLPFDGELRSQTGVIKTDNDPRLSYGEIITMNWLYENVDGRIPEISEINEDHQPSLAIAGISEGAALAAKAAARASAADPRVVVPTGKSAEEAAAAAKAAQLEASRLAVAAVERAKTAEAEAARAKAAAEAEAAEAKADAAKAKAAAEAEAAKAKAEAETAKLLAQAKEAAEAEKERVRAEAQAEAEKAKAEAAEANEAAKRAASVARKAVRMITEAKIQASTNAALAKEAKAKVQKAEAEAAAARLEKEASEAAADAALSQVRYVAAAGTIAPDDTPVLAAGTEAGAADRKIPAENGDVSEGEGKS